MLQSANNYRVLWVWLVMAGCDVPQVKVGPTVPTMDITARGVVWEEVVGRKLVRFRAKDAKWDRIRGEAAFADLTVSLNSSKLKVDSARLDIKAGKLTGEDFRLRGPGVRLRGKRVELELQSGAVRAWDVRADLGPPGSVAGRK